MPRGVVGAFRRLYRSYATHGAGHVLAAAITHSFNRIGQWRDQGAKSTAATGTDGAQFDQQFQVDTAAPGDANAQLSAIEGPNWRHGTDYQATREDSFRRAIASLPVQYEEFVFIDLGSGKGKALLMAADWPFHRIIGVEYCPALHQTAQRNIRAYLREGLGCTRIESICTDAAQYEFPPQPSVLYLYNPFDGVLLDQVVRRLLVSLRQVPRRVYIVYHNAIHADVLHRHGFRQPGGIPPTADTQVFEPGPG